MKRQSRRRRPGDDERVRASRVEAGDLGDAVLLGQLDILGTDHAHRACGDFLCLPARAQSLSLPLDGCADVIDWREREVRERGDHLPHLLASGDHVRVFDRDELGVLVRSLHAQGQGPIEEQSQRVLEVRRTALDRDLLITGLEGDVVSRLIGPGVRCELAHQALHR